LRELIGASHVLTAAADTAGYLTDQRGRFTGKALAVLKPGTTDEVAGVVRLCAAHRIPIVPQGGNTGLVLGSVPDASGDAVLLSLTRLNRIRAVDPINNTMTVEAGCILEHVQQAAAAAQRLFPLSLAAQGSCTIGGICRPTPAHRRAALRQYARTVSRTRSLTGRRRPSMSSLRGLRKDNTGYDLRDLFIAPKAPWAWSPPRYSNCFR